MIKPLTKNQNAFEYALMSAKNKFKLTYWFDLQVAQQSKPVYVYKVTIKHCLIKNLLFMIMNDYYGSDVRMNNTSSANLIAFIIR
jgi:hypothetical protein